MKQQSFSSAKTRELGRAFAAVIIARGPRRDGATVVALVGELGSGKTTFTQGFLRALGVRGTITSPTFILMRPHRITRGGFKRAIHVDTYRLKDSHSLAALGFKEILKDPANVIIIEWADRVRRILPKNTMWATLKHGKRENEREIKIMSHRVVTTP